MAQVDSSQFPLGAVEFGAPAHKAYSTTKLHPQPCSDSVNSTAATKENIVSLGI